MKQFGKFVLIGGTATALQYVVMMLLIEFFDVKEVIASALSYLISAAVNYLANYYLTFKSQQQHLTTLGKFAVLVLIALWINTLVFYLIFQIGAHYLVAQIIATLVTLVINFLVHKFWIYGQ